MFKHFPIFDLDVIKVKVNTGSSFFNNIDST